MRNIFFHGLFVALSLSIPCLSADLQNVMWKNPPLLTAKADEFRNPEDYPEIKKVSERCGGQQFTQWIQPSGLKVTSSVYYYRSGNYTTKVGTVSVDLGEAHWETELSDQSRASLVGETPSLVILQAGGTYILEKPHLTLVKLAPLSGIFYDPRIDMVFQRQLEGIQVFYWGGYENMQCDYDIKMTFSETPQKDSLEIDRLLFSLWNNDKCYPLSTSLEPKGNRMISLRSNRTKLTIKMPVSSDIEAQKGEE